MNKFLKFTILVSYAWNLTLLLGVVANWSFVLTRAAGGQFETFTSGIRVVYVAQTLLVLFQLLTWVRAMSGKVIKPSWLLNAFLLLTILGVITQLISRSANERWNAIPAALIAYGFWVARRKSHIAGERLR